MKIHHHVILLATVLIIALSSCSSNQDTSSLVATAIIQTQAAQTTSTQSPTSVISTAPPDPTQTPTPTFTPELTDTPTPTETPTPTPDLRVIDIDPKLLLMTVDDLPPEGKYYLPNSGWISPHRNSEVISGWGIDKGRKYLEETGRIDGWWSEYLRGTKTVNLPEQIYDNVVIYKSSDGARLVVEKYSNCRDPERMRKSNFVEVFDNPQVGDYSVWCVRKEMQPNGKNRLELFLEFSYKNIYHGIWAYGWESEVTPEILITIANNLLAKLENAPLSDTVTFTP